MHAYVKLRDAVDGITLCGGSTTCPAALSEFDVADVAEAEGLYLAGHAERSFLAEAAEAFVRQYADEPVGGTDCRPARVVKSDQIARLLKTAGATSVSDDRLQDLADRTERFVQWAARRIKDRTGCESPDAAIAKEALVQALRSD